MNRHNPFKVVDELIKRGYRIPVSERTKVTGPSESFITAQDHKTVNLGELMETIKRYVFKIQDERATLKKDLYTVTSNGSVRTFSDEYYSNDDACNESNAIFKKWFDSKLNFKNHEELDCPYREQVPYREAAECSQRYNYYSICAEQFCKRGSE